MGPACCWEWSWVEVRRRAATIARGARLVVKRVGMGIKEKYFKREDSRGSGGVACDSDVMRELDAWGRRGVTDEGKLGQRL